MSLNFGDILLTLNDFKSLRRKFKTLNYDETDFCKFTNYGFFDFM